MNVNNTGWFPLKETKHTLYVTNSNPATPLRQETLFNIACRNAAGLKGDTDAEKQAIVDAIYSDFQDRDVRRVIPKTGSLQETQMTYWGNASQKPAQYSIPGSGEPFTTEFLLKNGDGRCGAWATFLADILKVHGFQPEGVKITPTLDASIFAVSIISDYLIPTTDQLDMSRVSGGFFVKNWALQQDPFSPIDEMGIPAQGDANPVSFFSNH